MANTKEMLTKLEAVTMYLFFALMAGIIFVLGWAFYSSWNSWILF